MNTDVSSALNAEAQLFQIKNDLLLLDMDPGLVKDQFGAYLKRKLLEDMNKHFKRFQDSGDRRLAYVQRQLANKKEPIYKQDLLPRFFLNPEDRTQVYELVHLHTLDPTYHNRCALPMVFSSQQISKLYEA